MLNPLTRAKFRVKIKSLAVEAGIIRAEERRALKQRRNCMALSEKLEKEDKPVPFADFDNFSWCYAGLHLHRVGTLREEARATLLAYAYCRGIPYAVVELKCSKEVNIKRVVDIVKSLTYETVMPAKILDWCRVTPVAA